MKFKILLILLTYLLVVSCSGSKVVNGSNLANRGMSSKSIINTHNAAFPNFSTLAARMYVVYENGDDLQSITISLRMEKNKKIWVKASLLGITIAKLLITQESVSYYETISNTYFEGDFSILSKWLGTEIDFQKAQAILLGQSIFTLNSDYESQVTFNKYKLQPNPQPHNFIHSLLLNPDNFKISSEFLSQPQDNRMFTVNYGDYQKIEGGYYPFEIKIYSTEKETNIRIGINFKKIDHNASVRFPFKIPKGYEEIQLN